MLEDTSKGILFLFDLLPKALQICARQPMVGASGATGHEVLDQANKPDDPGTPDSSPLVSNRLGCSVRRNPWLQNLREPTSN